MATVKPMGTAQSDPSTPQADLSAEKDMSGSAKRKRGRPPKARPSVVLAEEGVASLPLTDSQSPVTPKRGRGRPRKSALSTSAQPSPAGKATPTSAARGRPKKDCSPASVGEVEVTSGTLNATETADKLVTTPSKTCADSNDDGTAPHSSAVPVSSLQEEASVPLHSTPMPASKRNDLDLPLAEASPIENRRSGRARKRTWRMAELDESVKPKKGRPRKSESVTTPLEENFQESQGDESVKPKKGRPRKSESVTTSLEENLEESQGDESVKPKKDRPRKSESVTTPLEENLEESQGDESVKPKKGRPRKSESVTTPLEENLEESQGDGEKLPVKDSEGRKKAEIAQEEEEVEKPKRGRGRPRKNHGLTGKDSKAGEESEGVASPVVKQTAAEGQGKKAEGGTESSKGKIEACLRCQEKMESLPQYKQHLMKRHAAVYSKTCPEREQRSLGYRQILKVYSKMCPAGEQSSLGYLQILKALKVINCPDCQKPFRFVQYFKHHLEWCGRENEKEECVLCKRKVKSMWMYQHMRDHKKRDAEQEQRKKAKAAEEREGEENMDGLPRRRAAKAFLNNLKESSDDEDDQVASPKKKSRRRKKQDEEWQSKGDEEDHDEDHDDDHDDDDGIEDEPIPRRRKRPGPHHQPGDGDLADGRKVSFPRPIDLDFFRKHQLFMEQQPSQQLHPALQPLRQHWRPLSHSQRSVYAPASGKSVPVCTNNTSGSRMEPVALHWGEAVSGEDQSTAFVGGPVRAVEWCPLNKENSTRGQLLAVSAGRELWESWALFERGESPGVIQFWATDCLDSRRSPCCPELRLAFSVAHSAGHVLSMSWCPRAAYGAQPQSEDCLQRMGLLAVAGYHGNVLVYSVPTPESLPDSPKKGRESSKTTSSPVYHPPPSLTLQCNNAEECGACLTVSWQKGGNCEFIAGGYAKGFIHLWHISPAPSPLVCLSPDTLAPVRCFSAHATAIFCLDWGLQEGNLIVSGSMENLIRVWDVSDTRAPLFTFPEARGKESGPIRAAAFASMVLDAVIFADDQRDKYTGHVCALDLAAGAPRSFGWKSYITLNKHAASIWDLSYSPWFNMVASSDNTGLVSLASCWPVHNPRSKHVTKQRKGLPVFITKCSQLKEAQDKDTPTEADGAVSDDGVSPDNVVITFRDYTMKGKKGLKDNGWEHSVCRQTFGHFQPADVMVTCFNPNMASSMWLASGTRAGFLRLHHLPCLAYLYPSSRSFFSH